MLERRWHVGRTRPWLIAALGVALALVFLQALLYGGAPPPLAVLFALLQALLALTLAILPPERRSASGWSVALRAPGLLLLGLEVWMAFTLICGLSYDRNATLHEMVLLGGLGCLFFAGYTLGRAEGASRWTFRMLAAAGGGFAAWAILSFLSAPAQLFGEAKIMHAGRLTASFLSANTAASVFGGLGALFFTQAAGRLTHDEGSTEGRLADFAFWLVPCLVCLTALLLTASRAGAAAALAVIGIVALITLAPRLPALLSAILARRNAIYVAAAAALILLIFVGLAANALSVGRLWSRVTSDHDAVGRRSAVIHGYVDLAMQRPLQGYGLGSYRALSADHPSIEAAEEDQSGGVHDIFVQWFLEGGLVGGGLMFATVGLVLATLFRRALSSYGPRRFAKGVLAFSAVLLLHSLVDYSLQVPAVSALWTLLLGLATGISFMPLKTIDPRALANPYGAATFRPIGQTTPVPPMPQ